MSDNNKVKLVTGAYAVPYSNYWGTHLKYEVHEDGYPFSIMDSININQDLPKIPRYLWDAMVGLFAAYSIQHLEVQVLFLIDEGTKDMKCLVPTQVISGGSYSSNYKVVKDIITGNTHNYPEDFPSYDVLWKIHSHNTMTLISPSCADDADELPKIGGYAILSSFTKTSYAVTFSIVSNDAYKNRRYFVSYDDYSKIVEDLPNNLHQNYTRQDCKFSAEVCKIITRQYPIAPYTSNIYRYPSNRGFNYKPKPQIKEASNQNLYEEFEDYYNDFELDANANYNTVPVKQVKNTTEDQSNISTELTKLFDSYSVEQVMNVLYTFF